VRALFALIRRLKASGLAIVYISHFIEEVAEISDRYVVLRDGRNAGVGVTADATSGQIVALMVGGRIDDLYPRGDRQAGDVLIAIDDQSGNPALEVRRGEVVGIAGLVGAGRTHLLRTIFGLEPVVRGRVTVRAFSGAATPHDRWRQGMGMLSEDRAGEGLAMGLSIADNMTLSNLTPLGPGFTVLPSRQDAAASAWIERLAIRCANPRQAVRELSGGNQQKVAVGRLLHHDVDILVLDEPTRGIDVGSKAQIYDLVDRLVCGGKAVLLVSSYLPELLGVCDRIAVMSRGQLGPARPVEAWTEHSLLMDASASRAAS
jgi:ribose transport system ATP-binding protein